GTQFLMEYESIVISQGHGILRSAPTTLVPVSPAVSAQVTGQVYAAESRGMMANGVAPRSASPAVEAAPPMVTSWADAPVALREKATRLTTADIMLLADDATEPVSIATVTYELGHLHEAWTKP